MAKQCWMHVLCFNLLLHAVCKGVSYWIHFGFVNSIVRTVVFDGWLAKLKDMRGKAQIIKRIRSAERGNFGDCASVGNGVSELRLHFGPGYRIYFCRTGDSTYVLLCAGTKRGQRRDIAEARAIARMLMED